MFLVKNLLGGGGRGGGGAGGLPGNIGSVLGGLLSGGGGGGRPGGAGGAMGILGGVISAISEAAAQYNPEPPPPRTYISTVDANESEEVRQFRRLFAQLAGDDMEVSPTELMNILNKVVTRHPDLKTDGFGIDTCRSMVAVMDSDTTGKLGFEEFKYLWNNIKKWQCIYKQFDTDRSGTIGARELPGAFQAAGFGLPEPLWAVMARRYGDEDGSLDFDNFISCLVRLDAMFRAFKSLDRDGTGQIRVSLQEWLQLTMYS
ncbi:LOW QUALITY PROTEIN: calpain small subunit 1 [Struthio camelus]|uniref:LOW QUALITY PROTEIN: calpain small subunit 1 n=1 Tax=Struthio camelus TaxID=8801 RepID=UPI003603E45C